MSLPYYILIKTTSGKVAEVSEKVKSFSEVESVHKTRGYYNIMAFVKANNLKELGKVICKIHEPSYVLSTFTGLVNL